MDMQQTLLRIEALLSVQLRLTEQEFKDYLQRVIILLIDIMRSLEGDEFAYGFLEGAINSIKAGEKPLVKMVKKTGAMH